MRSLQATSLALVIVSALAMISLMVMLYTLGQDVVSALPFFPTAVTMHPLFLAKTGEESLKLSSSIDFGQFNESALPEVCREAENNKNFPGNSAWPIIIP